MSLAPRNRVRFAVAWTAATWFGCGLAPRGPGTVGTLGAIPLYLLVSMHGRAGVAVAALAATALGIWASSIVAHEVGLKDPQIVVIDEVAGFLVTMLPIVHPSWQAIVAGFVLFRALDIVKPWPVRRLEGLPGGWGIVMDDVAAGAIGAAAMASLRASGMLA
jgi:phosphatidylglycerophosphatase A